MSIIRGRFLLLCCLVNQSCSVYGTSAYESQNITSFGIDTANAIANRTECIQFSFEPEFLPHLYMDFDQTVHINYTVNCSLGVRKLFLTVKTADPDIALANEEFLFWEKPELEYASAQSGDFLVGNSKPNQTYVGNDSFVNIIVDMDIESSPNHSFSFKVRGILIGRTTLEFFISENGTNATSTGTKLPLEYKIVVKRKPKLFDLLFNIVITIFVILSTIGMGCKTELKVVKEVLKKPIAPVTGFFCQYAIMPLLAFGIAKLIKFDDIMALGFFCAGCSPGGGASNIYTFLLDGDLSLSITMTLISTVAALGMIPCWLFTLGQEFLHGREVEIPFTKILETLAYIIVPVGIGILIKYKSIRAAKIILKIIKPLSVLCILFMVTVGIYTNLYIFKLFSTKVIIAGCMLPYFGFLFGGGIAFLVRQPWPRIKTTALETGIQNVGVAIILLRFSLPSPENDLSSVAPIAAAIFTPLPLLVTVIAYLIYKKCNKKEKGEAEENSEEMKALKNGDVEIIDGVVSTV